MKRNSIPKKYLVYLFVAGIVIVSGILLHAFMVEEASTADITVLMIDGAPDDIVFIADPHIRKQNYNVTKQVITDINALHPSLVLLGGDYTFSPGDDLQLQDVWSNLSAPVYAILGNHDYHAGISASTLVSKIIREMSVNLSTEHYNVTSLYDNTTDLTFARELTGVLEGNGVVVLKNEYRTSQVNGTGLVLVGVDDGMAGLADPPTVPKTGVYTIYLIHEPDLRADWGADLVLCGHTHGGQFLPRNLSLFDHTFSGLVRDPGQWTYVSRGIGTSNVPHEIRLFSTPEIVVINPSVPPETIFTDRDVHYIEVPG